MVAAFACVLAWGCESQPEGSTPALPASMQPARSTNANATPPAIPFDSATPRVRAKAVATWPHDTGAYTQGLLVDGARLLEGTGLEGHSELREVQRQTGRVERRTPLPASLFGEGIRPAIDFALSMSIIGGRAQSPVIRELGGTLRLEYMQYAELQRLSKLQSGLSREAERIM